MPNKRKSRELHQAILSHLDELLDEALRGTFPASDPIAIAVELKRPEGSRRSRRVVPAVQ